MSKYHYPDYSLVIENSEGDTRVIPCCCYDSLNALMSFAVATPRVQPIKLYNRKLKLMSNKEEILQSVIDKGGILRNVCPEHNIEQMKHIIEFATDN
jgi:hypothetical protein